jgi:hypothetical protein
MKIIKHNIKIIVISNVKILIIGLTPDAKNLLFKSSKKG